MQILNYTPEHEVFRQRLKTFVAKEVTPNVDRWEKEGIEPGEIWRDPTR